MSERNSDPEKKYEPALDAALEMAGDRLEELHREIESAAAYPSLCRYATLRLSQAD